MDRHDQQDQARQDQGTLSINFDVYNILLLLLLK